MTGDASGGSNGFGGTAALVGVNAADGSYTVHPNSLTDNISNIDTEPGNVNSVLGQWVYRTDANSSNTNTGNGVQGTTLCNDPAPKRLHQCRSSKSTVHMLGNFQWLAC